MNAFKILGSKELFEKFYFEKVNIQQQEHEKLPSMQRVK